MSIPAEFMTALPWLVLILVFLGMACLQWRVINALDQALSRLSLPTAPPPPPVIVQGPPPVTPSPPPAPPAPKSTGPFDAAPPWFQKALHEIGFHETGNNQGIDRYIALGHCGALGDPWCAIFANAMLESSGIAGTRSASSQSFRSNPNFVQLQGPALGAIVVFWRGTQDSGLGHVGFYRGENANSVWTLGGNENDMVQIEALAKSSSTFGLIGYWWPKSVPLPTTGAVMMPTGSPTSVTVAPSASAAPARQGVQTDIVATYFGGQQSAYGGAIDDSALGVALPFHFQGDRPRVRVTGKRSGLSVDCDIVDVGPWNTNDPYWQTGARPQAETGTDTRGRHTNLAGIDLTLAASQAIQIDGKGLVDWEFVQSPKVT
ncbi:hypothetical protein [Bradyrhizobium lablabi]|uniref:hypothetical protein n=1 Tax=Bradyrhizobium lablabi TaxID=722472 RepID=UPI00201148C7|nr:hypothetical protein [Bradyrhizobium lablabi]